MYLCAFSNGHRADSTKNNSRSLSLWTLKQDGKTDLALFTSFILELPGPGLLDQESFVFGITAYLSQ